jgi:LysM domain-containing protein
VVSGNAQQVSVPQRVDQTYIVQAGDSLEQIAARFYGDRSAAPAILLATNTAAGADGIDYIQNPDNLKTGQKLLIPPADEAKQLNVESETYSKGVSRASLPRQRDVSPVLVTVPAEAKSVVVATWTRAGKFQLDSRTATSDIWVTIVPNVRTFCRVVQDRNNLTLRLEQRLGLPPRNGKAEFVELVISDPDKNLFRPCPDFNIHRNGCTVGFSGGYQPDVDHLTPRQVWFLSQYYQSYALARPQQYPWTALGYTYDWGSEDHVGESEFVIPKGSPIKVKAIAKTEDYCRP